MSPPYKPGKILANDPAYIMETDRIEALRSEFDSRMTRQDRELGAIRDVTSRTEKILTGNGDPRTGIVFKMERMSDGYEAMKRFLWIIVTAAVGVAVTGAWYLITNHPLVLKP